ncbi:ABC transporter substrate-binding protein [Halomonas halocynthiae]|uniref:ABC transporter substrate-binding protein n=1 Tax=Halomonas halocynthiae TaxID=176290 RepID=UPI00040C3767|nr:ABC transporter substrate-binding protein [Halomonas halocynthiae]
MRYLSTCLTLLLTVFITPRPGLADNILGDTTRTAANVLTLNAKNTSSKNELVLHGALDMEYITPILSAFHQRYPHISITYRNLETLELHQRFQDAPNEVDILISSAMPWQYQLANDGYAQSLDSPIAKSWPAQARWRQELFAFTFEPVVMVVHRELTQRYGQLSGYVDLLNLLKAHGTDLNGRIVTYNPATSGAGYSHAIQEAQLSPRYWDLISAFGNANAQLVNTTSAMLEGLIEGRFWIGYGLLGSYAQPSVEANPELEIIIPESYVLVTQRTALVSRHAPNAENARTFMDFLLGKTGQHIIAEQTPLGALHPEVIGEGSAAELRRLHGDALRPLALTPALLATLDNLKRQALLQRWQREFSPTLPEVTTSADAQ